VENIGLDTIVYVGVFVSYATIRKVGLSEESRRKLEEGGEGSLLLYLYILS
jgi:hypothetical protein